MSGPRGVHGTMILFAVPLGFLRGALSPPQNAWGGLRWLMRINPLSYGLAGLWRSIYFDRPESLSALPGWGMIILVSVGFAVVMFLLASKIASARTTADLQS